MNEKRFYKIGEVSEMLEVSTSTLRYWEKEFNMLSPDRAPKGQRRYTPDDLEKIKKIHFLIKVRGLKVDAARRELQKNPTVVDHKYRAVERLKSLREVLKNFIETLDSLR